MAIKPIKLLPKIKKIASGVTSFWGRGGTNEFYPGGADDQRRFGRGKLARDIAELMQENRQKMLLGDSRYIYQSFSTVSGAVKAKSQLRLRQRMAVAVIQRRCQICFGR